MSVITPRNGSSLAQVVQTALNVVGRTGVSIETGGTGNGVRVPDGTEAAIEAALGWTDAEQTASSPTPPPTQEPTPATPQADPDADPGSDSSDPDPVTADQDPEPAVTAPAKKPATKKTTSSRRARRGEKG